MSQGRRAAKVGPAHGVSMLSYCTVYQFVMTHWKIVDRNCKCILHIATPYKLACTFNLYTGYKNFDLICAFIHYMQ